MKKCSSKAIQLESECLLFTESGPFLIIRSPFPICWKSNASPIRQIFDGLWKAHPEDLHDKGDEIPPFFTTIAVIELLILTHAERRRSLRMKRAQSHKIRARLSQNNMLSDDLKN